MNKEFDIIIIGAGIVGLTFAKALAKLPLQIAIVDRSALCGHFLWENPGHSGDDRFPRRRSRCSGDR